MRLPEYYARAVRENDVDVIAAPDIDITEGQEEGPVAFDAVVEIRPTVTVGGYDSLRVTIPSPNPTDEEIDEQLERLRTQFGELEVVERPVATDDYATVDIAGSQDGEPLEGLTADDYLYQVGSGGDRARARRATARHEAGRHPRVRRAASRATRTRRLCTSVSS